MDQRDLSRYPLSIRAPSFLVPSVPSRLFVDSLFLYTLSSILVPSFLVPSVETSLFVYNLHIYYIEHCCTEFTCLKSRQKSASHSRSLFTAER